MPDGGLCERCHTRPATIAVRHVRRGRPPTVRHLCEQCLREGRMEAGGPIGRGPLDRFLARTASQSPGEAGAGGDGPLDIARYFTEATRRLLQRAAVRVTTSRAERIGTEHLLWSATEDPTVQRLLRTAGVDVESLRGEPVEDSDEPVETEPAEGPGGRAQPGLSPDAKRVLLGAFRASRQMGSSYVGPEHVLLALARAEDTPAGRRLGRHGVSPQRLLGGGGPGRGGSPPRGPAGDGGRSDTPVLDQYGRDLTALARDGELDPVIGRETEIEQTIEILSRRIKNNPVLIGEAGVGKTAIAEGIAQQIVADEVPTSLRDKRFISLNLGGMVAGTRYRGEFEERMERLLEEIRTHADDLLLFIDELHTLVGAGAAEGGMDAANMLKPALARGELHAVGATTLDEYRTSIEQDAALARRFSPVHVDEPTVAETIQILHGLQDRYEAFHRVTITDEAVRAAASLSDRYLTERFLPDKAIDLIDQAGARVRLRHESESDDARSLSAEIERLERDKEQAVAGEAYERAGELKARIDELRAEMEAADGQRPSTAEAPAGVTAEDIAEVISRATGIPVAQLTQAERERLLGLEERLHERVVGQDEAVSAISEAVRRSRAGLSNPDRPVGSFLFLGPTGVGKTELARSLAEALFGDEDRMVRFDMSEFQERHTVSRLVGAPPGYVGFEEAGQLTEQVRRRPYSVVLLDEIEKAHPDVFNTLLQVLDEGHLTDAQGRQVDFKNTVVIMTSNLGSERIRSHGSRVGFRPGPADAQESFEKIEEELHSQLRRELRPEFLNRIDEIVVFRPLDADQLHAITRLLLDRLVRRLAAQEIGVRVTDEAVDHLAESGYDPEFGARPLERVIQRQVENELSRLVLEDTLTAGDAVSVGLAEDGLSFDVEPGGFDGDGDLEDWTEQTLPPSPAATGSSGSPRG